jgi:hypothetical protein
MHTVDDWISYLEVLQHQSGVKRYFVLVMDLIRLLRASPKDLPSREAWVTWLGNIQSERANVNLDALLKLLRGCAKDLPIRIPLHSLR